MAAIKKAVRQPGFQPPKEVLASTARKNGTNDVCSSNSRFIHQRSNKAGATNATAATYLIPSDLSCLKLNRSSLSFLRHKKNSAHQIVIGFSRPLRQRARKPTMGWRPRLAEVG